ncbi:Leucine-rich repeat serine/threonine-protein kinase 2 [Phytophthora pseudosyringae]|uniref:Leucine-rich repeat serine/threonine-protein kinase 2 n=1 Tax=Phytophthora pseudosyringae TaxID=221518 RepID=A0A8T1VR97_9STRA|nr:Leucine-rich repeat serine/threonine-protein kinase 2 [Phytophthora pseudosyringae]
MKRAAHSEISRLAMTTFIPALSFSAQAVGDASESTRSPTHTSPVDYDGSSESDSELLLSLFGHPEHPSDDVSDRGGRPFPYTRSKTRWRKRPNDELKYLRSQIHELERLVATLSRSGPRPKLLGNGHDSDSGDDNQAEALRKLSHESHKNKVEAALAENRKLKSMVASHFHIARSLQAALDENMRLRARKVCWPSSAAASDELVFALLDEEKELQYAATDKVLDASGIARIYHPYFSEPELHRDTGGVYFQHSDVRVLPFCVADVVRALRHSLTHGSRVGPTQHCRKFLMHDAFSQAVTVDSVEVPGTRPAEIKGRHLLWSVVKPDRTVINWSSFNEYDGAKHIRLLKRLWFSVEPIALHSGPTAQGCILRTIVRLTPVDPETKMSDIEDMVDVIISGYKRDSVRVVMAVRDQLAALVASRRDYKGP